MTSPVGYEGCVELYGDPRPYIRDDGSVTPLWEARMVRVPFPAALPLGWTVGKTKADGTPDVAYARSAAVNQAIADEVARVFGVLEHEGLWRYFRTYDGGYTWRMQRGSATKISVHAFGAGMDFDANTNKLRQKNGDMNRDIVRVFESLGWTWGGRWQRPDPMHFQFARGI